MRKYWKVKKIFFVFVCCVLSFKTFLKFAFLVCFLFLLCVLSSCDIPVSSITYIIAGHWEEGTEIPLDLEPMQKKDKRSIQLKYSCLATCMCNVRQTQYVRGTLLPALSLSE